ncbi:MAG: hypothetical protein IJQ50_00540 [Clostridia bacterium]|nr:hypothetical protein [Clostridia bacterium]
MKNIGFRRKRIIALGIAFVMSFSMVDALPADSVLATQVPVTKSNEEGSNFGIPAKEAEESFTAPASGENLNSEVEDRIRHSA